MLYSKKIHKFYFNNKYIVLDINSGAVHLVDKIAYDVLDYYESKDLKEILSILSNEYSQKEIEEAYEEINKIKEEGLLFSEAINIDNFTYNSQNVVKALCLHVAHDCNLRCKYCFASQGDFKGERLMMPLEVGKKALEFIVNSSGNRRNLEVDFFGGEPLMNFELVKELVSYGRKLEKIYNKRFRFTITTNGVLLDEDNMEFINENMDNVVLSLDGRKEVNDNMRKTINGQGSYDTIVPKIINMVRKRGDKDYFVRGTFTGNNLDFTQDILEFYNLGFKKVSIEPVVTDPKEEYAIKEEDLDKILKEYEKFSKEYIKIKKVDKDFTFFHFMINLNQGPCVIKRATGCGAGSEYMAVTPEGDLYPCHQFVGNEDFKLGDVYEGVKNSDIRQKFKQANVFSKEECKNCWARFYCSGGCHANAFNANKDITKPYKIGCEMEKKRIECAISILANLE
ncbi:thioether cross-link-forming SCIFF peptide maturase [Anaerosalibacter massiliensis]|uniref:thioether cross-link-forming SCIFF peptide maturase n=1 Tax=Anaerosalibacter massiliensis TaxID=1347392 RepID=UPI0005B2543D|nr:thioether cross-link-forming SCIFF peptide maturase [Anaerosalibacter massiliensis]